MIFILKDRLQNVGLSLEGCRFFTGFSRNPQTRLALLVRERLIRTTLSQKLLVSRPWVRSSTYFCSTAVLLQLQLLPTRNEQHPSHTHTHTEISEKEHISVNIPGWMKVRRSPHRDSWQFTCGKYRWKMKTWTVLRVAWLLQHVRVRLRWNCTTFSWVQKLTWGIFSNSQF